MTILLTHDGQTMCHSEDTRVDYIHEAKYASLGLATLEREPYAFRPLDERRAEWPFSSLPMALRLDDVQHAISLYLLTGVKL